MVSIAYCSLPRIPYFAQAPAPAPAGLQATVGDLYVSLIWQPVDGATQYKVYRSSSASSLPTDTPAIQYVQAVNATDANVTAGQTYTYQVTAVTPAGETAPSATISATPQVNLNPIVKMTMPLDGMTITSGTKLTLSAMATARTGSVSRVDFYADTKVPATLESLNPSDAFVSTLIGTATTNPYSITAKNLPVAADGQLRFRAVATDTAGHTATSASISITVDASAPIGTSLTPAQALTIAQTFCTAVGTPVPNGTPTRVIYQGLTPSYYLPTWKVGFLGVASVEVADANSVVTSYFNQALSNQLNLSNQSPGVPITQAAALAVAATVLQASKQPANELVSQQAMQSQLTSPATYAGDLWTVQWARAASGVPYRNDSASLLLQAETGTVEAWSLSFAASPPSGLTAQAITRGQAQQAARAAMDSQGNSLGLSGQSFQAANLAVVQPDTLWQVQGGGTTRPTPGIPSSITWDCVFTNATDPNNPSSTVIVEVWVDSSTGQVVGGDILKMMGRRKPSPTARPLVPKAHR